MYMTTHFLGLCLYWFFAMSLPTHDYHSSIAEVRYQSKKQTLEVEIHVFTDDLEVALKKRLGLKQLSLDASKKYQTEIGEYILAHFKIQNAKKQLLVGKFVGKETDFEKHICYIEFPAKNFSDKWTLRNDILTEIYEDQFNIVNFFYSDESRARKTLSFKLNSTWDTFN